MYPFPKKSRSYILNLVLASGAGGPLNAGNYVSQRFPAGSPSAHAQVLCQAPIGLACGAASSTEACAQHPGVLLVGITPGTAPFFEELTHWLLRREAGLGNRLVVGGRGEDGGANAPQ